MTMTTIAESAAGENPSAGGILNLSCYKFTPLEDLPRLRQELRELCRRLEIKGTILLSKEGINFFVAGPPEAIATLVEKLRDYPGLGDIQPKESYSDDQPFSRMLVRIKQEIIAFGVQGIEPAQYTSKKIPAVQLKEWLDQGRPVTLLDVRNNYEVEVGTFDNAVPINVNHFRDFPQAAQQLPPETKEQPIVMFCTGGIRCEKAGPLMEQLGFREIYQLDGGILKYFEEVGGDHWHGECFVFDKRVALDPHLSETATTQCYACLHPLTPKDQQSTSYQPPNQCPYCVNLPEERRSRERQGRQSILDQFAAQLPGSMPYDNVRPLNVPLRFAGMTLIDYLEQWHPHVGRDQWLANIAAGRLRLGTQVVGPGLVVREGMGLRHLIPDTIEPPVNARVKILYDDPNLVVVNKPAPLPAHPCGRFNRHTLDWMLQQAYRPQRLRLVHRLDADTSGLTVVARHRRAATAMHELFQSGRINKTYLVRVQGHPPTDSFVATAAISEGPGEAGLRTIDPNGLAAETRFVVLERFADGSSLLEAQPITGRTHQIRIHLWGLGFPVLGDSGYLPNQTLGDNCCRTLDSPPLCLHAWKLSFPNVFSESQADYDFETEVPEWASEAAQFQTAAEERLAR